MKLMKYLLLFILFSLSHTTNINIPEDHHTLNEGINTSSNYDDVVISEIKYYENITFEKKKPVFRPLYILDDDTSDISQAVHPFNFIKISIQLTQNINHNTFYQFYESQNGLKTSITTPFYWGDIQASIHVLPYIGKEQNYIDFIGIHQNIKWGKSIHIFEKLRWYNAIGTGYYIFYFSKPLYSSNEIFNPGIAESELSTGFLSQLQYSFNNKINLNIETNIDRIFTYKHIDMINVSMGISYLFKTPDWMILLLN